MTKSIQAVGLELASDEVHQEAFGSQTSLLDWDIILFRPSIGEFTPYQYDQYQGKIALDDTASFALKEACEHWRREIKQALETSKTIIVFLPEVEEVFVATGQRTFSGTGRNQKISRSVTPQTNYSALPIALTPVNATGSAIKLATRGADIIAPYWNEFGSVSQYNVLLPSDAKDACLLTKHGDRVVGTIIRAVSGGSLVLFPDIDFQAEAFFEEAEGDDEPQWSEEAKKFAGRMIGAVVALDRAFRASSDVTPEPSWAADSKFSLSKELHLRAELLESERLVEEAQKRKESLLELAQGCGSVAWPPL